ncbi:isoliquiritigenin 2'-O-methyltransferase [Cajanus cajan]|nr:isoliquiritigenin 2'-O-methyltransferase [Cajanus cajan]
MGSNYGEKDNAWICAMNNCLGSVYSGVLKAAVELNLFDIIAKASVVGVSASDIATQLPTQHPELAGRLDRMLCLLASNSLLICSTRTNQHGNIERFYQVSPAGKYFVKDEINGSLAFQPILRNHLVIVEALINFKEVLLDFDKGLFEKVHGVPFYEYIQSDPTLSNVFNKAMSNSSLIMMNKILETYEGFEEISLLVDVGGGIGQNLNMIISKYPSINGINFDLPHAIRKAPIHPGIKHVEGDMFKSVPKGDAILLKVVLHNWSDEECIKILSNCYEALPQNGKVIVVDCIVPEEIHSTDVDKILTGLDNMMLLNDGSERTEKQFENLCKHSGFSHFHVATRVLSTLSVIEFRK